jgi:hypothetical protein
VLGVTRLVHLDGEGAALGDAQRRLEAFGEALAQRRGAGGIVCGRHLDAIDDDVDVVLLGLLQLRHVGGVDRLAVDAKAHVALRLHLLEQLDELALAIAHDRGEHHQSRPGRQGQRRVDHLADALGLQRQTVVRAVRRAGAGEEQAQVVVDLGDRADGRARVVRGRLLLDRDRRRQALDDVDVGLVHQLQELARVRREALDVAALTFGVQRVERQARLARSRQAGDDDQPVPRDVEVDVLEVVGARAAHPDHRRADLALEPVGSLARTLDRGMGRGGHRRRQANRA